MGVFFSVFPIASAEKRTKKNTKKNTLKFLQSGQKTRFFCHFRNFEKDPSRRLKGDFLKIVWKRRKLKQHHLFFQKRRFFLKKNDVFFAFLAFLAILAEKKVFFFRFFVKESLRKSHTIAQKSFRFFWFFPFFQKNAKKHEKKAFFSCLFFLTRFFCKSPIIAVQEWIFFAKKGGFWTKKSKIDFFFLRGKVLWRFLDFFKKREFFYIILACV